MSADRRTVVAGWRGVFAAGVHHWTAIDTDWKSVAVGLTIVGLVVGFDVPVPG